jgi:hypothetical protein
LAVFLVKFAELWEADGNFRTGIATTQKFIHVIVDQVIFENAHQMGLFVVNEVVDDFDVVVLDVHAVILLGKAGNDAVVERKALWSRVGVAVLTKGA